MLASSMSPARIWVSSAASAARRVRAGAAGRGALHDQVAGPPYAVEHRRSAWSRRGRASSTPSSALREYCASAARSARSRMASLVPVGESEGRLMIRPVDSFSWLVERRPRPNCSEDRDRSTISRWVIRAAAHQRDQPGPVDQGVEHRVHGGQHPGGALVAALGREQVDHLLVDVDPGQRLAGGVDLGGEHRLVRRGLPGGRHGDAERRSPGCGRRPPPMSRLASAVALVLSRPPLAGSADASLSGSVIATCRVAAVVPAEERAAGGTGAVDARARAGCSPRWPSWPRTSRAW